MKKTITVAVAVYKVEKYLTRCVDSILNQTFTAFELLLIDDGSPDSCGEICDSYALKDERVRVIHQKNAGLAEVRNVAVHEATCDYITFIDSDDFVNEKYLEILYSSIKENDADISMCCFSLFDDKNLPKKNNFDKVKFKVLDGAGALRAMTDFSDNDYIKYIVAWNKLIKRSLFDEIVFPAGKLHEDEATTYKLFYKSKKVVVCDAALYYYYRNDEGIMRSESNLIKTDVFDVFEEKVKFFSDKPEFKQVYLSLVDMGYEIYNDRWDKLKHSQDNKEICEKVKNRFIDYYKRYKKIVKPSYKKYFEFYMTLHPRLKWYYKLMAHFEQ